MQRRILEVHPEAVAEARAARAWYERRSPVAANAFVEELEAALERILDAPEMYGTYLHGTRGCLLRRFPYIVVYRLTEASVQVIAVAHARRRPGYWRLRSLA